MQAPLHLVPSPHGPDTKQHVLEISNIDHGLILQAGKLHSWGLWLDCQ